jgi:5-methylcytosine-specific restriction endonuclease McrA
MAPRKGSIPSNFVDLTGQLFGRLTVVGPGPRLKGRFRWVCLCSCGTTKNVEPVNLRSGRQVSCGCYNDSIRNSRNEALRVSDEQKRQKARARSRKWALANRDREYAKLKADPRRWAKAIERTRQWGERNLEARRAFVRNRRARIKQADGHHTGKDIVALRMRQGNRCAVCQTSLRGGYHADHITPLSRGGTNYPRNIQLLCPTCNLEKHARDPVAFMQMRGFLI